MKYRKNIIRFGILPVGIIIISIFFYSSSLYLKDGRFFSIVQKTNKKQIIANTDKLISDQIPHDVGTIGTVIVHFQQPESAKGSIIFTLTEEISGKTLYQNKYSMHDIYYQNDFPFGFPPIEQKRGEKYTFAITPGEGIVDFPLLKDESYPYEVLYQFDKTHILKDTNQTLIFLQRKLTQYGFYMLHSRNIIFYLFPVLLYFFLLYISAVYPKFINRIKKYQHFKSLILPSVFLTISIMSIVSVLYNDIHPIILTTLSFLWIILVLHYKILSETTFLLALLFLMVCPLLLISDMPQAASNAASWSFMLILIGSLQGLEIVKSKKFVLPFISHIDQLLKQQYHRISRYIS